MPPPSTQSNRREEELLSNITPEESKKILPALIPLFAWVSRASYSFETPGSLIGSHPWSQDLGEKKRIIETFAGTACFQL